MEGGFPYVLKLDSIDDKRLYTQNLITEIFEKDIKKYYSNEINFDKLLENNNYFSNTKPLLLKEETGQISFFD